MSDDSWEAQIESCQGMVRSIALAVQKKLGFAHELDDLIAYGQIGLAQAAKEFDASKGAKLSTYAYYRIRGAIYDGVAKMGWQRFSVRRAAAWNETLADDAEQATDNESDARGDWLENLTQKLATASLLLSCADAGELADKSASQPLSVLCKEELQVRLHTLINQLPPDSASLIRAMYFEGQTMQDAAANLGISKSWASRTHAKALQMLGDRLRRLGFED